MDAHIFRCALREARARYDRRAGVLGFAIGQACRGEHFQPTLSLIILVEEKLSVSDLARRHPFEAVFDFRCGERRYSLPIDVQGGRDNEVLGLLQLSGTRIRAGARQGTVGGIVQRAGRALVIASGHVVGQANTEVLFDEAEDMRGIATELFQSAYLDHALLDCGSMEPGALCPLRIRGVRSIGPDLIGTQGALCSSRHNQARSVPIRQVYASCKFSYPSGPRTMRDLIATDRVTQGGDSGALLYDPTSMLAIGHVLGAFGNFSYFVPCDFAFQRMGVQFWT